MKGKTLFLVLVVSYCFLSPHAYADQQNASSSMYCIAEVRPQTSPPDTTEAKKKRVKKKKTAAKPDTREDPQEDKSDDEESFFTACAFDCLGSLLESLCSGWFSSSDDTGGQVAPGGQAVTADAEQEYGHAIGTGALPYRAAIKPINPYADEVTVWKSPGGANASDSVVTKFASGTQVSVQERSSFRNVPWVKVERSEDPGTAGWVQERELTRESHQADVTTSSAFLRDASQSTWHITTEFFAPLYGRKAIHEEYGASGFGIGAEAQVSLANSWQAGLSLGYAHSNGEPQFDYVTPTVTDSPMDSDLDVWRFSATFGQRYSIENTGFVAWSAGPSIFNVQESAHITVIENKVETGTRIDELSKWKAGGELKLQAGMYLGMRFPIGLYGRFSLIPWDTAEEKSLTLDHLGKSVIYVFDLGISFGYSFF